MTSPLPAKTVEQSVIEANTTAEGIKPNRIGPLPPFAKMPKRSLVVRFNGINCPFTSRFRRRRFVLRLSSWIDSLNLRRASARFAAALPPRKA